MARFVAMMSALAGRFASPAARFRCAVGTGFVVAAVGSGSIAAGGIGRADDMFSAFGSLFSGFSPAPQYGQGRRGQDQGSYAGRGYGEQDAGLRHRRSQPRTARRHPGAPHAALKLAMAHGTGAHDAPVRLGRKSMCVRLCDGFAFPVGAYNGDGDRASHEATCQAECPGAQTALYVLPNGSEALAEATEARSGRAYSQMPAAFHYTTFLEDSCSCHPRGGGRLASLLHDFTLRRGDAVMTATGVKVFHGGHLPYRPADFITLARSRDVASGRRATFHAIERASLSSPANLARPATAAAAALQKQASLSP